MPDPKEKLDQLEPLVKMDVLVLLGLLELAVSLE